MTAGQRGRRILVVDDEPNTRLTLEEALAPLGYEVVLAASGEEAIALSADPAIALVLLDLRMPGVDGLRVLEHLQRERPGLRVVIVTAHGTVDTVVRSMRHGAVDVVQKPFTLEQIRGLVSAEMDEERRSMQTAGDYDTHLARARELIREGHVSAAEEHVTHAIHADRARPDAYNLAGVVALLRGDRPAAQRQWRIALTQDPAYAPAQKNLSVSVRVPSPDEPLDLGGTAPEGER